MSRPEPFDDGKIWLPLEAAVERTGRSLATIKRLVSRGLVEKRLVRVPGQRDQAQVLLADLEREFGRAVNIPTVGVSRLEPIEPKSVSRLEPTLPLALERIANWPLATGHWPLSVKDKLCWTLAEARTMTGLSLPALRELVEAHPDLAIRRGRRYWFRAGKLRGILG